MRIFARRPVPRRARLARAVTASAEPANAATAQRLRRLTQPWQPRALGFYDTTPETWYPAQFYARALARIRFFPAILNEQGEPEEQDSGPLVDLFERVQDPGGGRSELAASYGRLMFLIGDGYLVVTPTDDGEEWEFLSPLELRILPDAGKNRPQEYARFRAPGVTPEQLVEAPDDDFERLDPDEVRVWRLWRRHPAYSEWADSPVKAVVELYELLTRLTLAAGAESLSRIPQGLFFMPDEAELPIGLTDSPDDDPQTSAFQARLTEILTSAIANPGSAEAMTPTVLRAKGYIETPNGAIPMKDAIGNIPLVPEGRYSSVDAWDKVIARISYGLDMPAEMVTGVGDTNHWSGWLLDESGFRQHIAPVVQKFCDDLNAAYLRPAAEDAGIPDADRVVVGYDAADAVNHPDEIKTAQEAWDRGVVSNAYYLDKIGATEDDAPDEAEYDARALWIAKKVEPDQPPEGETAPDAGGKGGDTTEEPPAEDNVDTNGNGQVASLRARIEGAAELAIGQMRAKAGSRLVAKSKNCADCKEAVRPVPQSDVASALGESWTREIIDGWSTEQALVSGAREELAATLARWGVRGSWPDELSRQVEEHAVRTLYVSPAPSLPREFSSAIARALQ